MSWRQVAARAEDAAHHRDPEQVEAIHAALPDEHSKLLVETDVESGLRWGELTELRPLDLHTPSRLLTIARAAVHVSPRFHPDGGRFLVKYPKDQDYRRLKLSPQIVLKLQNHILAHGISPDALIFTIPSEDAAPRCFTTVLTLSCDDS